MSKNKDNRKVVLTHLPISKDKEEVFAIAKRSRLLINSICEYSKELRKRGVKVFERHANIIRTSEGYYMAWYEDDIKENRTEEKKMNLEPFTGLDGRQKIQLTDKDGECVISDLATLMAKTFLPNPENYEYVLFKDKDPKNLKIENLYWAESN